MLVRDFVWSEADQKRSWSETPILMLDDYGVAYSRQNCIIIEGAAQNLPCLHARSEQKHSDIVFNLYYIFEAF